MSVLAEVILWLGKVLGGEALKSRLARRGTQAELRALRRALLESQQERDELAGISSMFDQVWAERDDYLAQVTRLRIENSELRAELERLRKG